MKRWIAALATLGWVCLAVGTAAAESLPQPEGRVILTVTGRIGATNAGKEAHFDRAMLKALPWQTVETYTAWNDGKQRFSGFWLKDLMARVKASGTTLRAHALNDYEARISMSDLAAYDVLVAAAHDGEPMPIRERGPLWILYLAEEPGGTDMIDHNEKMVWQLDRLVVE